MEKASSDSLTRVLSAADGLLASRIFLEATPPTMNQHHCNAIPFFQQNPESLAVLSDIQIKLEDFRASMMTEIAVSGFAGLDTSLDSFANSTLLFEAALGSFRNTLTGTPPNTVGDVVALYSLSQITSCYLRIKGNASVLDIFSNIDVWGFAISVPGHRRAFNDLVQVLRRKTTDSSQPYHIPALYSPEAPVDFNIPSHWACQGMPSEISWQCNFEDYSWEESHLMPDSLVLPNLQFSSQDGQNDHTVLNEGPLGTPLSAPQVPELQNLQASAVITNLVHFLEECGELLQILSGRGVTTSCMSPGTSTGQSQSEVQTAIKSSFIQPLQNNKFFVDNLSAQRLLVVANRFVELGYLRSIDETRRYLINVGNAVLSHDNDLFEFSQSVFRKARRRRFRSAPPKPLSSIPPVPSFSHILIFMRISSPHTEAMLPIDGLLASLIYLDKTKLFADLQIIQSHKHWGFVQDIRSALDWYWDRLISVTLAQELPGREALLRSFPTPMSFYEAAIFTFRNTLTGLKPESLDAVIALCILSHVALSNLRQLHGSVDCDLYLDNNVWRDTIQDLGHRQTFSRLIEILFPETLPLVSRHTAQPLPPARALDLPSSTPHQNEAAEALPPTIFTIEDDMAIYDMLDSFLGCSGAVDTYPATPSSHAMVGVGTAHHTSKQCGESMLIFSGRGLTAKDLRSCVAFNQQGFATKNLITASFIQPLRKYDICKEPSILGILSIVDRFVDLGYLQTICEVRDYMLFVGREVLASDKTFPEFCQTVRAITRTDTNTGDMPIPPLRPCGRGSRKPARKKIFDKMFNMKRHVKRRHSCIAFDAPPPSGGTG
ncbi:hypothetical protein FAVG1_11733 [Fusarium avenaceum]|nr:hypothetical protein FAVG1_11733 [Fusarium avenaceum]